MRREDEGMRWLKPFFSMGESLLDRILCVAGAVLFAQAPEFMQQYLQRLGGHLAEARRQLAEFEQIARHAGRTLHELIAQYAANADASVVALGRVLENTETRVAALAAAETALREASVWERPFVFLRHVDWEIARATGSVFKPAVPTTMEGLLYALAGMVVLLGLYHGLLRPLGARIGRCFSRTAREVNPA
jgi:hypothetical protein